jgi:hypothetical protein
MTPQQRRVACKELEELAAGLTKVCGASTCGVATRALHVAARVCWRWAAETQHAQRSGGGSGGGGGDETPAQLWARSARLHFDALRTLECVMSGCTGGAPCPETHPPLLNATNHWAIWIFWALQRSAQASGSRAGSGGGKGAAVVQPPEALEAAAALESEAFSRRVVAHLARYVPILELECGSQVRCGLCDRCHSSNSCREVATTS